MSARSRNKGAAFERAVAAELRDLTGVRFERNLEQCRADVLGDLVPDDAAWPFAIECKRHAAGVSCLTAWKVQATAAAGDRIPAVVFKFDRQPIRVAVPLYAIHPTLPSDEWAEITLPGLAYLAREIMAAQAMEAA